MATKAQMLETINAIDPELAEQLKEAKKQDIESALTTLLENEDEESRGRRMAETLKKYAVTYEPSISYSGRKSLNTGDDLAHLLAGMSPRDVITVAERALGLEPDELWEKYQSLNPGQQRMNAGNRIRSAIKRGDITEDQVKAAIH